MITTLNHSNSSVSRQIRDVFQASYAIEAELLGAKEFPPLKRPLEKFINSETQFLGYMENHELAAVIEIEHDLSGTHINSLVVHPDHFRKGIGRKLVQHVFDTFKSSLYTVETGVDNGPATTLYLKMGFAKVEVFDTPIGIKKVRFEKRV